MKRLTLIAVLLAVFAAGCAAPTAAAPLDLSTTRPSLLFFYTDN